MFSNPKRLEIDHRTIKLLIGLMALSLAGLTWFLSGGSIVSISESYHKGGLARDVFVGFHFAISAFLLAYNGRSKGEMVLSKLAAFAAMGVALFPCKCVKYPELIPHVHGISAAVMFLLLAAFCYIFFKRARAKGHSQARLRAWIYVICGIVIVASILVIAIDHLAGQVISSRIARLVFYGEWAGLTAFGVAWLCASRIFPLISSVEERFSPFSDGPTERGEGR